MLIWFVVLYLLVSIGIGLYAATRVHNAKDFAVAGRHLPLPIVTATVFATWFGAETVLGISATFVKEGLGGVVADPVRRQPVPDPGRPVLRQQAVPHEPADHRRLLPCALQPCGGVHRGGVHRGVLSGLGVGADHGAGTGVQRGERRRGVAGDGHGDRRADRADLHHLRRHVVGGAARFRADDGDHVRHAVHRLVRQRHDRRRGCGGVACAGGGQAGFLPARAITRSGCRSSAPGSP